MYRLAAEPEGVEDYRKLVDEKLNTFGELYDFMVDLFFTVDQLNDTRSLVLEVLVAIPAVLDAILLFRARYRGDLAGPDARGSGGLRVEPASEPV